MDVIAFINWVPPWWIIAYFLAGAYVTDCLPYPALFLSSLLQRGRQRNGASRIELAFLRLLHEVFTPLVYLLWPGLMIVYLFWWVGIKISPYLTWETILLDEHEPLIAGKSEPHEVSTTEHSLKRQRPISPPKYPSLDTVAAARELHNMGRCMAALKAALIPLMTEESRRLLGASQQERDSDSSSQKSG